MILTPQHPTLVELLQWRGETQPDALAYRFLSDGENDSHTLTYHQLDDFARKVAAALQQFTSVGDRVLLLLPSGLDYIGAFAGCLYAGAISVTAYPPKSQRSANDSSWLRLRTLALDAEASVVLTTSAFKEWGQSAAQELPELTQLHWIAVDDLEADASAYRPVFPTHNDLAFLQYTSGSTATPKGVMVSHKNLMHNLEMLRQGTHTHSDSVFLGWLPLFHDMGLIGMMLHALYVGAPYTFFSPAAFIQKPARWLNALSKYRGTYSGAPNFAYDLCVDKIPVEERHELDLSCWHEAFNGAEPVRPGTIRRFIEAYQPYGFDPKAFDPCYGLAESTLLVSIGYTRSTPIIRAFETQALEQRQAEPAADDAHASREIVACGSVSPGHRVRIVNPETHRLCSGGEIGEIWIQSDSVAQGYWRRPEQTEQTFQAKIVGGDPGGFLRTGDLGFLHDGQLYLSGRLKDMLILRGANHYPQDIEATVESCHPALRPAGCAAFAVEREGMEQLVVVQELHRTALRSDPHPIYAAIRQVISAEHGLAVAAIVLVRPGGVNKTTSGKVQRAACRAAWLNGTLSVEGVWQASTETPTQASGNILDLSTVEREIRERIAAALGVAVESIRPTDTFAQCGLDSLTAVSLSGQLQAWLNRPLPPTLLYDYPTVRELAQFLSENADSSQSEDSPLPMHEPIAIVGMGCRFPGGAVTPEAFWQLLTEGKDAVVSLPARRRINSGTDEEIHGGFLDQVDEFDAAFFGITPREAAQVDPQQRLLLETAWEAMEDAGITRQILQQKRTGVYIGAYNSDYFWTRLANPEQIDPYTSVGNAHSIMANRLSYFLDLRGPSLTVDTACSSSLTAVHLACQALRQRECDAALTGAVNLIVSPLSSFVLGKTLTMAADNRCKAFDARADGIVRGEGAGVLLLKRLSDALADGDTIAAVIRGSAINQDGRTNGMTAPNGLSQQAVIRQALRTAGVGAEQVGYVEAHGTGTPLGDPIELSALQAVYGCARTSNAPCFVGSVKTNFGHLEAAAGIAGLIKSVLTLQHKTVPPHLHYQEANPYFDSVGSALAIPTRNHRWRTSNALRYAGVSSFGFGGTNVHVILEEALSHSSKSSIETQLPYLIPLSAAAPQALAALAKNLGDFLTHAESTPRLADIARTLTVKREHFPSRFAVICDSVQSLAAQLTAFSERNASLQTPPSALPRLAFVFSGQGAQWSGMGQELFEREPIFRQTMEACDRVYQEQTGHSLLAETADTDALARTETAQPALCAIQIALVEQLRHWGVVPDAVVGHSMGEIAAAYCAGVFGLEETMRLIIGRAQLMETTGGSGRMLAVSLSAEEIAPSLNGTGLTVAALNGARSVTVSGGAQEVETLASTLQSQGVRCQFLPGHYAFHSEQMGCIETPLKQFLRDLIPKASTVPFVSTVTGKIVPGEALGAAYWYANLRQPVQFSSALETLLAEQTEIFIEIGAQPVLTPSILAHIEAHPTEAAALPTIRKGREITSLLHTVGILYTRGCSLQWNNLSPADGSLVSLPRYPFQRQRHWLPDNANALPIGNAAYAVAAPFPPHLSTSTPAEPPLPALLRPALSLTDLEQFVSERILSVLGLPHATAIDRHQPLASVGLESLMIVELKRQIEREYDVRIPTSLLLKEPTLAEVAQWLFDHVAPQAEEIVENLPLNIDELSDDEVTRLLSVLAL